MSPLAEARKYYLPKQFTPEEVVAEARQWAEEITPSPQPCKGEECQFRAAGASTCELTVHHTIFPKVKVGLTRKRALINSRRSPASKVLTYQCRHTEIHQEKDEAPFPDDKVAEAYYKEARVIEDLGILTLRLGELDFEASAEGVGLDDSGVENYLIERENLRARRRALINRITELRIITEPVIKGALLELAPDYVRGSVNGDSEIIRPILSLKELRNLRIRRLKQDKTKLEAA